MARRLLEHLPEFLMEAAGLGIFMMSAALFGTLLEHPGSVVRRAIGDADARRALMGLAMGLTAVGIFYSPWGKRSGAHLNPAVTLTFYRLGKVPGSDAAGYVAGQLGGGLAGVLLAAVLLRGALADPSVNWVVTLPGSRGEGVAFLTEALMAFGMMTTVLLVSGSSRLAKYTPLFAGGLVAVYIALLAPLSGMSLNPARTLASAVPGRIFTSLWIYLTAPFLGMLLAAETVGRLRPVEASCAKLRHDPAVHCIFCLARQRRATAA